MRWRNKSIRLKGYDYGSAGYYFVTICTKNRFNWFGEIQRSQVQLSEIGEVADSLWLTIPKKFNHFTLDQYIIMPDHVHGVLGIKNRNDILVRQAINHVPTKGNKIGGITGKHNPMLQQNLSTIIRWYKGRCTFEIHKRYDEYFEWQSRFYEHIIRNNVELKKIRKYIKDNPRKL